MSYYLAGGSGGSCELKCCTVMFTYSDVSAYIQYHNMSKRSRGCIILKIMKKVLFTFENNNTIKGELK
jgi:hypothetical protein